MVNNPDSWLEGQILLLDKPYGWTSFYLVKRVKRSIETACHLTRLKVGHAGTLDPLATGLMIVAVGKATKRIDELQAGDKEYLATIRLGATTPGFDLEKEVDAVYPFEHVTEEMVRAALPGMTGPVDQVPPLYSAKKIAGVRAYDFARKGEDQVLQPKRIQIHELELLNFSPPDLSLRITCSRGTYIRSIARDLGLSLGSGGHLIELKRTRSGDFKLDDALTFENFLKILP
jgi:tRNA pseudouridine55 synthase